MRGISARNRTHVTQHACHVFFPPFFPCAANGGEFRQTFHGYPRGYAQLIESPQSFWPFQLHFINTRANVGRLEPASSRAPPDAAYSGLIECPCTTRRGASFAVEWVGWSGGYIYDSRLPKRTD